MKKKRILIVIGSLNVGGAENHLLRILPKVNESDFEVFVYTTNHRGTLAPHFEKRGVKLHSPVFSSFFNRCGLFGKPFLYGVSFFNLCFLILKKRPSVIHFFLPGPYLLGGLASLLVGPRCRVMSRRSLNNYQEKHPFFSFFERSLHPQMSMLLANSRAIQLQLIAEGAPQERVGLLYNGIDIENDFLPVDRKAVRKTIELEPGELVMIIVANLYPYKGHRDLLHALAGIKEMLPEKWTLLCVGRDINQRASLMALTEQLGLSSHVRWLGQRDEITTLLSISDIGILASHEEGFSNSLLEYMAANLPVVATRVGGNPEAVIDGEVGFVVSSKDPSELGKAILKLSKDRQLREKMGEAARLRVVEHFSLASCVASYIALYQSLLECQSCAE